MRKSCFDKVQRKGLEGTHVYKVNGYYYLYYYYYYCTYGGGDGYQVALRAKSINGPYEKKVVLRDDMNQTGKGVHQGALVQTQTGEWWSVIFQDRDGIGRVPTLQPVTWTDGWPRRTELRPDGPPKSQCVSGLQNGSWLQFDQIDFGQGVRTLTARVAAGSGGGTLELHLDRPDGPLLGPVTVPATGGGQMYATVSCPITAPAAGRHTLVLKAAGRAAPRFNLDWFSFRGAGGK